MSALSEKAALLRSKQPAIAENGDRLATIKRPDGDELRLHWSEYEGHRFLNIQIWSGGYPQKDKRVTVGVSQLPDFAAGVEAALDRAIEQPAPQPALPLERKTRKTEMPMPPSDDLDDVLPLN